MNSTVTTAAGLAALLGLFAVASLATPHEGLRFSLRAAKPGAPRVERCPVPPLAAQQRPRGEVLLSQAR